jgi:hypothetical protein
MNARNLCAYFLLPAAKGFAVLAAVHRKSYPRDQKWVTFAETPGGVTGINVEQGFVDEIVKQIDGGLRNNKLIGREQRRNIHGP